MTNLKDIYYVAGLLEGEGCFYLGYRISKIRKIRSPQCKITMSITDVDTAIKLANIFNTTHFYNPKSGTYKKVYNVTISNSKAIGWMMTIYSLMSTRRKAKIKEIIDAWKSYSNNCHDSGHRFSTV